MLIERRCCLSYRTQVIRHVVTLIDIRVAFRIRLGILRALLWKRSHGLVSEGGTWATTLAKRLPENSSRFEE
jgi:hypothetical protein